MSIVRAIQRGLGTARLVYLFRNAKRIADLLSCLPRSQDNESLPIDGPGGDVERPQLAQTVSKRIFEALKFLIR